MKIIETNFRTFIFSVVITSFFFSCGKERGLSERITLEIIDKEIHSKFFKIEKKNDLYGHDPVFNTIRFKITNHTKKTQVIYPLCFYSRYKRGCCDMNSFPKKYTGLNLNNLLIEDEFGDFLNFNSFSGYLGDDRMTDYIFIQDSLVNLHYIKLGYKTNKDNQVVEGVKYDFYNKNTIMIEPKETLFFETYFSFPYNKTSYESSTSYFMFDKDKNYKLSLVFYSDTTNVKKDMSRIQRLNHENNDREFFSGELKSKNSIPIIFH
ncbi:hypothetical protein [Aquimarina algiphila]|uniref:hypothetical protein n=1 Tax=Aquimarina algiphila TaxID=2047982 RepID=UPI002331450E|nr:hypothetical protein [Aquimarina algiphila]